MPVREWNSLTVATMSTIAVFSTGIAATWAMYHSLLATVGGDWIEATLGLNPLMVATAPSVFVGAFVGVALEDGLKWVESAVQQSLFQNFLGRALGVKEPGSLGGVLEEIHANEGFRGEISICDGSSIYLTVTYTPKANA